MFENLDGAGELGEVAGGGGIIEVAGGHGGGKGEVLSDEGMKELAGGGWDGEAGGELLGEGGGGFGMGGGGGAFSGVVEEDGEAENGKVLEFEVEVAEALVRGIGVGGQVV